MIVPDVNLLIYAYDADSPLHAKASVWWQECLSGAEQVGLPPAVLFGFMRISTNARVFDHPLSPAEASHHIRSWLAQPVVQVLEARGDHIEQVLQSLEKLGTAGNLVTDAVIAALAIQNDAVLHTNDTDFMRFPGLQWFNPLTGVASAKPRKS